MYYFIHIFKINVFLQCKISFSLALKSLLEFYNVEKGILPFSCLVGCNAKFVVAYKLPVS